jgi:hypothetical protein
MVPVIGLLLAAILASASPDSSNIVEVDIGHGYAGSESFAMSGDRVLHTQRVADASGEVSVRRSILHPNAKVWKRFWLRIDEANVWQWTFRYSDVSRGMQLEGARWSITLHHGAQSVESSGYNSAPNNFSDLQAALDRLVEESAVDASDP